MPTTASRYLTYTHRCKERQASTAESHLCVGYPIANAVAEIQARRKCHQTSGTVHRTIADTTKGQGESSGGYHSGGSSRASRSSLENF